VNNYGIEIKFVSIDMGLSFCLENKVSGLCYVELTLSMREKDIDVGPDPFISVGSIEWHCYMFGKCAWKVSCEVLIGLMNLVLSSTLDTWMKPL